MLILEKLAGLTKAKPATQFVAAPPKIRRIKPEELASTQEAVAVLSAQDSMLVLRNGSVVAGVGFGSMSESLLSANELQARIMSYRDVLRNANFQLLIGTRPQNLNSYLSKMQRSSDRLAQAQQQVDALMVRMPSYVADTETFCTTAFTSHFGFRPDVLRGLPGGAHDVATTLCDASLGAEFKTATPDSRQNAIANLVAKCEETLAQVNRWQKLIAERADFVEMSVEALQTPVRTFFFITSFSPNLINLRKAKSIALSAGDIQRAGEELTRRCDELMRGLRAMRLPHWRATHDELLEDMRHFYHPAQSQLAHELRAERSVAMRLASVA
jgi:hypothetical protein